MVVVSGTPPKKQPRQIKIENDEGTILKIYNDDVVLVSPKPKPVQPPPKLLNQSVKILNKQAPSNDDPLAFQNTIVTKNYGGNVVTEIVLDSEQDHLEIESEAVTNAAPVETNVFPCPNCERSFPLRQLLDLHMANHVRDRKFACKVCQKAFFSKYDLGKHMLIHTGEKPFQCVVCDKAFSRSTLLRRHEKIHIDQPKFLCVYCERPFLSKDELDKHTVNHLKNRPFVCPVCGKGFAFKQGLERHEVIHSNVQPFQCEHCDQSFSTQSKLARHLTAHAGSRPYPCRICPKSYLLSHHLTRHLRSHKETDLASYKCFECSEVFDKRDDLIYHSAVHATESLTCPLCKEQFADLDDVTCHIKSHTDGDQYACEFCESIFVTEDKLREHCDDQHAEELAFYDKDDKARQSSQNAEAKAKATTKTKKSATTVEVIEEYIISDAIIVNEDGQNVIDKQLISEDELAQFGAGQLEFETDDGLIFTIGEDDDTDIKEEHILEIEPEPTRRKVKSYLQSERKSGKEERIIVVEKEPTTKSSTPLSKPLPKPTSTKKFSATSSSPTKSSVVTKSIQKKPEALSPPVILAKKSPNTRNSAQKQAVAPEVKVTRSVKKPITSTPTVTKSSPVTRANRTPTNDGKTSANSSQSPTSVISPSTKVTSDSESPAKKASETLINMKIGDKMIKVQQIRMSKAQIAQMTKEGKLEMKGGQMVLKQSPKQSKN